MAPNPFAEPAPLYRLESHDFMACPGNCREHPAVLGSVAQTLQWMNNGASWGDIVYYELLDAEAAMSPAEKAARAAADAAIHRQFELDAEAAAMFQYAESQKIRNTVGKGKQRHTVKHQAPCKWLYCDEKVAKVNGKAPIRNYLTGAQCWAYEYTDPRTGEKKKPHTCGHLHPDEPGWLEQWNKDRHYKPGDEKDRFVALKGRR
jgi:hypothetical protein